MATTKKAQSPMETVTDKAGDAASAVGSGAKKVVSTVAENPLLAAAGAVAVGAAVGGRHRRREEAEGSFEEVVVTEEAGGQEERGQEEPCQERGEEAAKKSAAKKSPAKKSPAKKSSAKKSAAKKGLAKKSPAKKGLAEGSAPAFTWHVQSEVQVVDDHTGSNAGRHRGATVPEGPSGSRGRESKGSAGPDVRTTARHEARCDSRYSVCTRPAPPGVASSTMSSGGGWPSRPPCAVRTCSAISPSDPKALPQISQSRSPRSASRSLVTRGELPARPHPHTRPRPSGGGGGDSRACGEG